MILNNAFSHKLIKNGEIEVYTLKIKDEKKIQLEAVRFFLVNQLNFTRVILIISF